MKKIKNIFTLAVVLTGLTLLLPACDKEPGKGIPGELETQGLSPIPTADLNDFAGTWEVTNTIGTEFRTFRFSNGLCWVDKIGSDWSYSAYRESYDQSTLLFYNGTEYVESLSVQYVDEERLSFSFNPPWAKSAIYLETVKVAPISTSNWTKLLIGFWTLSSSDDPYLEEGSYWFFCSDGVYKQGTSSGYFYERSWSVHSESKRMIDLGYTGASNSIFQLTEMSDYSMTMEDDQGNQLEFLLLY